MQIGTSATTNELQQMREQLEQQTMQTRQALAQLMLVREQLITETNARIEAQVYSTECSKVSLFFNQNQYQ